MAEYVSWEQLSDRQQVGMTRDYWDSLTPEQQQALFSGTCIEPGCQNPRWLDAGSFYCEQHAREHSAEVVEAYEGG